MDYKKILEGVVDIINTAEKSDIGFANICTYIGEKCPELAESEDEKIRKELIDIVTKSPITFAFEDKGKVLAWLEKQGEQKPQRMISAEAKEAMYDKPAWSEDDEKTFVNLISYGSSKYTGEQVIEWLNSLKQRMGGK